MKTYKTKLLWKILNTNYQYMIRNDFFSTDLLKNAYSRVYSESMNNNEMQNKGSERGT